MKFSLVCPANVVRALMCLILLPAFFHSTGEARPAFQNKIRKQTSLWTRVNESNISSRGKRSLLPEKYVVFSLDQSMLGQILSAAPLENGYDARGNVAVLTVPDPNGKMVRFRLEESPILSPAIAAENPRIKTYQGYGIDAPGVTARFDWTDAGFHGYIFAPEGTYSIDPFQTNDTQNYLIFYKKEFGAPQRNFHCKLDEMLQEDKSLREVMPEPVSFAPEFVHGAQIRTHKLAIATTFEWTSIFRQAGDTDAQAKERAFAQVTTSVNRISGVYRKEFAISFTLVSGTNLTFAVNPESPADYANTGSPDLNANVTNINSVLGAANYDIGHVFGSSDNGVAQLSSVCGSSKARGYSGQPNPVGDPFDIDYVAHEMGHQYGGNHTFSGASTCGSSPTAAQVEPGSAVTIMGYAGICAGNSNVQRNSIDTFHVYNLQEIINFVTTGNGSSCGVLSGTNAVPVISPLTNYTLPINTPFVLTASATDSDSDPLTYNWEQRDAASSPPSYPLTPDDDDISLVGRPGFRSFLPTVGGSRTFPNMEYVLNNANEAPVFFTTTNALNTNCGIGRTCISGEDLPSAARTLNFRVSVRDGRGGISDAGTIITIVNTGTFKVSSLNTATTWNNGESRDITWDVAGTNANGIDTANVKISLSTDGGLTFPTVLAASTPNDGSYTLTVPGIGTTQARVKIEGVGHIFFDVNDVNFTINAVPISNGAIGGRLINAAGRGIGNAMVVLTGGSPSLTLYTRTSSFGYYRFNAIPFGQSYTITPQQKRYTFNPLSIVRNHNTELLNLDFTGNQ